MAGDWNVEAGRLWAVGLATAVVAALAALVVFLFATQVFDQTLFVQEGTGGDLVELTAVPVLVVAVVAGILATLLLWLLLLFVPRGDLFFGLIATIVWLLSFIVIAVIPDITTENRLWLAGMHTVAYLVIVPTLSGSIPRVATPQVSHTRQL